MELIDFALGLTDDEQAVINGCSEPWRNGMTEGFINKVKWIKRSSYGQAGFALLQRRVRLHPTACNPVNTGQGRDSSQENPPPATLTNAQGTGPAQAIC